MLARSDLRVGPVSVVLPPAAPRGEVARCEQLFADHHAAVYQLCLSRLRDPEDAEDATQETFARAVGLGSQVGQGWLITVAGHVCTDNLRRRSRRLTVLSPQDGDRAYAARPAPEAEVMGRAAIRELLDQLTAAERGVVAATVLDDHSHFEAARRLGIAAGTSRALLSRATRKLRLYLRDHPVVLGVQAALPMGRLLLRLRDLIRATVLTGPGSITALALPGMVAAAVAVGQPPAAGAAQEAPAITNGGPAAPALPGVQPGQPGSSAPIVAPGGGGGAAAPGTVHGAGNATLPQPAGPSRPAPGLQVQTPVVEVQLAAPAIHAPAPTAALPGIQPPPPPATTSDALPLSPGLSP